MANSITLYTGPTSNGHKVAIALKEMQLDYRIGACRYFDG